MENPSTMDYDTHSEQPALRRVVLQALQPQPHQYLADTTMNSDCCDASEAQIEENFESGKGPESTADSPRQDAVLGSVGPLLNAILTFISDASFENSSRSTPSSLFSSAKITLGRFRLWAKSFDGEEFDMFTIINDSHHLKETIASLLSSLTTILVREFGEFDLRDALLQMLPSLSTSQCLSESQCLHEASESAENESGMELDNCTDDSCDDNDNIEHLSYIIDSLMRLLPALEDAMESMIVRQERTKTLQACFTLAEIYITIIREKYPRIEPFRARILAQGIIDASDHLGHKRTTGIGNQETLCPSRSALRIQDSALGTSISKSIIFDVSDLMTVVSSNKNGRFLIPSMPKPANDLYREHVFGDLMPYMCINNDVGALDCGQPFGTWREWMEHDQITHPDNPLGRSCSTSSSSVAMGDPTTPSCPFGCQIDRQMVGENWYRHVSHHMEDIRLLALPPSLRLPRNDFERDIISTSSASPSDLPVPYSDKLGGLGSIVEQSSVGSSDIINDTDMMDDTDIIDHNRGYTSMPDDLTLFLFHEEEKSNQPTSTSPTSLPIDSTTHGQGKAGQPTPPHEHHSDSLPRSPSHLNPNECRSSQVKQRLEDVRAEKLKEAGHIQADPGFKPDFFPVDVIQEVLCEDTIRYVLGCPCNYCRLHATFLPEGCSVDRTDYYQDIIRDEAMKLFALLVVMDHPALIGGFLQQRSDHVDTILTGPLDHEALKTYLPKIGTKRNKTEIEIFFDLFLTKRLRFSPPIFKTNRYEPLDPNDVFPFINTTKIGSGGYGNVYSFQFYPGYLRWDEFKDLPHTKFAMKEVSFTPTLVNNIGNEARALMKINKKLKDERRIVQVLKLFRRGDKMHFIFRLADGNLEELLRNETRSGKVWEHHQYRFNPGLSICQNTLWDEAIAANILVFGDGTLVINDFGQAHIGQKRSSDSATRDVPQRPGEQAYRPPESSDATVMNQGYDDWAMGCILLEILVYVIYGPDGTKKLHEARGEGVYTDYYYQTIDGERKVHPSVERLLKDIAYSHLKDGFCTAVVHIIKTMLMIRPKDRLNTENAWKELQRALQEARPKVGLFTTLCFQSDDSIAGGDLVRPEASPTLLATSARQSIWSHDYEMSDEKHGQMSPQRDFRYIRTPDTSPQPSDHVNAEPNSLGLGIQFNKVNYRDTQRIQHTTKQIPPDHDDVLLLGNEGIGSWRKRCRVYTDRSRGTVNVVKSNKRLIITGRDDNGDKLTIIGEFIPETEALIPVYAFKKSPDEVYVVRFERHEIDFYFEAEAGAVTEHDIRFSSRSVTVTLKEKEGKSFGRIKFTEHQLQGCLVQLWTESKRSISGDVPLADAPRADTLPEFISRLIVFNPDNNPIFISVPLIDGKIPLDPVRDPKNNTFTIRRRENASLQGCEFATEGDRNEDLPGIPMSKVQFRKQEIDDKNPNYKKYTFVRLELSGKGEFDRFSEEYVKLEKSPKFREAMRKP
ncbi:hypothetical protein BDD12DRAFT_949670 [Trichophaea hybrida]|nr:hypothetical protein BDD12DRAFT_949670 [Trichophaea hybrida]